MRTHKYNAKQTVVDGIKFPSKREAQRYCELKVLEKAGKIKRLELQVRFPLFVAGVKVATYIADFCYYDESRRIVEDCKGFLTPVYRLKKKMFEALYRNQNLKILET